MTTIRLISPTGWQVVIYGDALGEVYLDTGIGLAVAMTKALDRLDEIQQVTQEAALAISLPATERNKAILERFRPDVLKNPGNPISVEVMSGGERTPVSSMLVMGYDGSEFDVDLFADDWIEKLTQLQLRDLDLGIYTWEESEIIASWAGARNQLVMPLLAHFGGWYAPPGVVMEDLRLCFNHFLLLKSCFCAIGWELESEHLRVGNGAYAYSYLSGERWYSYRNKEDQRFVIVNIDPPRVMAGTDENILFDVVSDPLSLYNNTRPFDWFFGIAAPGPFDVVIEVRGLKVMLPAPPPGAAAYTFFVQAYKNDNGELVFLDFVTAKGAVERDVTRTLDFTILDRNATGGDSYGFFFGYGDLNPGGVRVPYNLLECSVYFRPDFPYYERTQDIHLADLFQPGLAAMTLFTAVAELCNGKIETDFGRRIVRLQAANNYTAAPGTTIPGFFQRTLPPLNMTSKTVPGSLTWKRVDMERERFFNFSFAEAKDAYILQQQKENWFDFILDRKRGKESTKDFENKLFEPTLEIFAEGSEVGGLGIFIPALWDNILALRSNKIGPRVLVFYGEMEQFTPAGVNYTWSFEGDGGKTSIPYFAQVAGQPVGGAFVPLSFNGFANDLFRLYYKKEAAEEDGGAEYEVFLTGGDETYLALNFRRTTLIQGEDAPLEVQVLAVRDHEFGTKVPVFVLAKLISC